ncbi:hypothetical protein K491DRAFT_213959 [Lophiostoma macrostomum CBS 122681]|uniref:Uncharacterized protein n=1 Tax=Lophiostoma macrostomum CBS 122681 TaxID=1314788 RepID=A0A6A6SRX4_9PLEO|nr:hypothetical protein K491DRAFT_213959 [Lophiostoma macrostomum CBS 122681]
MDETITIAISLGLTSVVAASALSADGKASTATVIRWPKSPSAFAPLNILCKDGDLYWGHESPLQNARTCFGLARPNRSKAHYRLRFRLDQELIRKRALHVHTGLHQDVDRAYISRYWIDSEESGHSDTSVSTGSLLPKRLLLLTAPKDSL